MGPLPPLDNTIERGHQAKRLLEDPVLQAAFSEIRENIHKLWASSKAKDVETREGAYHRLKALEDVQKQLETWMTTGEFDKLKK